ncbi:MAG: flagellar biosynthetic protein FliO [bacterium]
MFAILVSPEVLPKASNLITIGYVFQLILSLAIVIGLIYFSAKYLFPKLQLSSQGKLIQIVDRIGLEPQVSAYIISVHDRSYLIVVGQKGVTLIDKLESGA